MFCSACGKEIHETAKSCPFCGAQQKGGQGDKNRVTAALLALFLGGFGAHKFYMGHIGFGFLYLIFFWTFIPALVALVEFIIYILETDESFEARCKS